MQTNIPMTDEEAQVERARRLHALALSLVGKRDDAIAGRQASGIERDWTEDEEAYEGIDDANRHIRQSMLSQKPTAGGTSSVPRKHKGSTAYVEITRPYVDAAAARLGDMLLPTDDRNWAIEPTPIPDMPDLAKLKALPEAMRAIPDPVLAQQLPAGVQAPTLGDLATEVEKIIAEAKKRADRAQTRIDDWLKQGHYNGECRAVIDDAAKVGSGVMKGPVAVKLRTAVWNAQTRTMEIRESIDPGSKRISYWDFFPDPACGDNIHRGNYVWERDTLTGKALRDLKGLDYLDDQIDACLAEGPASHKSQGSKRENKPASDKDLFEVWYFHGQATRQDVVAAGCKCEEGEEVISICFAVINDRIVKAYRPELDKGEFPYDIMCWQKRAGSPWGRGVARQMQTPQRQLNAAVRNMMDNAGIAAGGQFVIHRGLKPVDGEYSVTPRKFWWFDEESGITSAANAMNAIVLPMLTNELMVIVEFALKAAEIATGLPMLLQGQVGSAPDTLGGQQLANDNASGVLRRITRNFDDSITVPHVGRYYDWLMQYGEDDEEKGDLQIIARGSGALLERDMQNQFVLQLVPLANDPAYKIDKAKLLAEICRSRRLSADRFQLSEEDQAKAEQAPPPQDPRIRVAEINAEAKMAAVQADTDRDTVFVESDRERNAAEHQARMTELQVKRELAMLDYANRHQITVEQIKASLAETAAKVNLQRDLASASIGADLHKHHSQVMTPPVEPAGRARDGQAFAQ